MNPIDNDTRLWVVWAGARPHPVWGKVAAIMAGFELSRVGALSRIALPDGSETIDATAIYSAWQELGLLSNP